VKAAKGFVQRHKVTFPNLIGTSEQVTELYSRLTGEFLVGTPSFLVFDPKGELVAKQAGAVPVRLIENFIKETGKSS